MGRNINSDTSQPMVPINGAIFRNNNIGLITDGNGAQYVPSNSASVLSSTDYPQFVSVNAAQFSSRPAGVTTSGYLNNGTLVSVPANVNFIPSSSSLPYLTSGQQVYNPFCGQQSKFWFNGATGTNGSITVMAAIRSGYRQNSNDNISAYAFNSSGTLLSVPTIRAAYCWYDATTTTFRIIGATPGGTFTLYTSSNAVTWTATTISQTSAGGNGVTWTVMGSPSYPSCVQVGSGQKVFITVVASSIGTQYACFASTNNGATFTDVTRNFTGSATDYFNYSGSSTYISLNYDGTTLFLPASGRWRYSTNDGATFTDSTITGVTTSLDNSAMGAIRGPNASTFMYIMNNQASANRVFVTTNGGQSFTSYSYTPTETISSSYTMMPGGHDGSTRWCFAYQTANGVYAATSTDNGANWTHTFVNNNTSYSQPFICAWLDDAFYIASNNSGIWRSTNGTTWTCLVRNNFAFANYMQPYYTLTSAVVIGNYVIRKSDQAIFNLNSYSLASNFAGYYKNFGNYVNSDMFIQGQYDITSAYQMTTSATAFTGNMYSPPYLNNQQGGSGSNTPRTIEYWRIR